MSSLRHKVIPAVYLVLMKDNAVLLGIRSNTGYADGKYGFISGHAEANEPLTQAIIREAQEEAGIILSQEHLKIAHIMHRKAEQDERMDVFFTATTWQGNIVNNEPSKCLGWEWLPCNQLPENIVGYIRTALTNINHGVFYDEHGW